MTDVKAGPQPSAIPPPDRSQLERLNSLYRIIDKAPAGGGLRARLASGARRLSGRVLSRQQEFNAVVVDHINRNMAVGFEAHQASINTIEWVESNIDGYEDARDEIQRHLEALLARERRNDAAVRALAAQHDELRTALGVVQQAAHTLKREIARLSGDKRCESRIPNPESRPEFSIRRSRQPQVRRLRGSVSRFAGRDSPSRAAGTCRFSTGERCPGCRVRTRRVPRAAARARRARARHRYQPGDGRRVPRKGLQAETGDALAYLRALPDSSLGGLFAAQVVEHLEPALSDAAARRRLRQAPPRRADCPRNDQPGVLVRLLRKLHSRSSRTSGRSTRTR